MSEKEYQTDDAVRAHSTAIEVKENGAEAILDETGMTEYVIDPKAESRLVWKFDLRILPVLAVMYLL
jgi:hypothetical protein